MDYAKYRKEKEISRKEMIEAIQAEYPLYSKATQSMVDNPNKYGICLTANAEKILTDKFGLPYEKRKPKRRKANRLVVYLNDDMNVKVRYLMLRLNYDTVQDFLEAALTSMVDTDERSRKGDE